MRFSGKVAVITGGGRGIGAVFADELAREGAAVAVLDTDEAAAKGVVAKLVDQGRQAIALRCDVADERSFDAAAAETAKRLGGIDFLVGNAGLHLPDYTKPVSELPRDMWRRMLDVNVVGIVNGAAACRPYMRQRGGGVIVNISSIAAFTLRNAYGISKLAVRGLTVALAQEFAADNIRVYGIAPGPVDSQAALDHLPAEMARNFIEVSQLIKRQGHMLDLAGALKFFCSEDASFITGETLVVGGGFPQRL